MLVGFGCSVEEQKAPSSGGSGDGTSHAGQPAESVEPTSEVLIDGSGTVFPISQAVAEEFQKQHKGAKVVVGTSGTGGGFKRFVRGETDVNDASRPIETDEIELCKKHGIDYVELTVATDGLSVVVNPNNDWCDRLTVEQLRAVWEPGSKITRWKQLNEAWPDEKIGLYGPNTSHGTFDYFTEAVNGKSGASRTDYTAVADYNVAVQGIIGDRYSLGYFGYAYYVENQDKLKVLGISPTDNPAEAVKPSPETIENGTYHPLSRPLFLYVNKKSLKKPELVSFLQYYLADGQALVSDVGYVRLGQKQLEASRQSLQQAIAGAAN